MNKPKKPKLTEAEIELFRATCKDIQTLENDKLHLPKNPSPIRIISKSTPIEAIFYEESELDCLPEEKLYFARPGLQNKILNQLRRGSIKIEAHLDLHQLIGSEALATSQQFLENAQARAYKWVLIIHGKGHFSRDNKPVLKSLLNKWLTQQPMVLAFASSQAKHGGTGALYVLLKRGSHE